ncbi:cytidylate kinase [Clostridium collagenovorans DSM 3089]|uniref:Cytidylate kinase n=1 Tax=Clostridium collagenovorans DSM 3089 TaxID=1121306 RepID=A0A1M5TPA5_9CLOT|nr:(d)CMP kinase [Clostridium collagenovorans]SHH52582.1 cytidylate kinase [Clostridium collagenovorans DSM 3089]
MKFNVAIDGPAGAGKSTIAKQLGEIFDLMYVNTGAMYRVVTFKALEKNISETDIEGLVTLIDSLEMYFDGEKIFVNGEFFNDKINTPYISNNVSKYAAVQIVREKLVKLQRDIAKKYNVIMDGRDIGTVVLKDAKYKFYLTAKAEARAKRRFDELINKNIDVEYDNILKDIKERDYKDMNRELNPLKKAEDSIEIDSTELNIEEVIELMSKYINSNK